jgi:hypothetical protein
MGAQTRRAVMALRFYGKWSVIALASVTSADAAQYCSAIFQWHLVVALARFKWVRAAGLGD